MNYLRGYKITIKVMKKTIIISLLALFCGAFAMAQTSKEPFKGTFLNKEYQVYLTINFQDQNVKVPRQEILGELPGFFGDQKDSRKWLITGAEVKENTAYLEIVNDYGSEDLEAELTLEKDGTYTLEQKKGSTIKIARNRKWVKIPKKLTFTPWK